MKKHKIVWILLLAAFIVPVGFSEVAFADTPPGWFQKIDGPERWIVGGLNKFSVLDKETGLVWEKSPKVQTYTWPQAVDYAYRLGMFYGRKGWRLPTVEELASLVADGRLDPSLPDGNPFVGVQYGSVGYWTASTVNAKDPNLAWQVSFHDGSINGVYKSGVGYVWCVRGGHAYDH